MSYLWDGEITLQVTSKGSPTIRTWSIGSIVTDTGFSAATKRQAGKDSTTASPATSCALEFPQGLATISFPSSSISLRKSTSFPWCTCPWEAVQAGESTAGSTVGWKGRRCLCRGYIPSIKAWGLQKDAWTLFCDNTIIWILLTSRRPT